jgi:hypothetical protein
MMDDKYSREKRLGLRGQGLGPEVDDFGFRVKDFMVTVWGIYSLGKDYGFQDYGIGLKI